MFEHRVVSVLRRFSAPYMYVTVTVSADKESQVRSDEYGRDLSSVQTLLTKEVCLSVSLSLSLCLPVRLSACRCLKPMHAEDGCSESLLQ